MPSKRHQLGFSTGPMGLWPFHHKRLDPADLHRHIESIEGLESLQQLSFRCLETFSSQTPPRGTRIPATFDACSCDFDFDFAVELKTFTISFQSSIHFMPVFKQKMKRRCHPRRCRTRRTQE